MKKKILIIDDDTAILEATKIVLEANGYSTKTLTTSKKIESNLKTLNPDLILIDLWLQGEGGDTVTKNLKSNPNTRKIPVIIMSANQDLKRVAKEARANAYLPKPFDIDNLVALVKKYA